MVRELSQDLRAKVCPLSRSPFERLNVERFAVLVSLGPKCAVDARAVARSLKRSGSSKSNAGLTEPNALRLHGVKRLKDTMAAADSRRPTRSEFRAKLLWQASVLALTHKLRNKLKRNAKEGLGDRRSQDLKREALGEGAQSRKAAGQ